MPIALSGNTQYNYNIPQSLAFRSYNSTNLSRTPTIVGSQNTWTVSFWVKRGTLGTDELIFAAGASGAAETGMYFMSTNAFRFYDVTPGNICDVRTTATFADPGAWYHIVVIYASNNPFSASDRLKIYINGVQQTSFSLANYPANNQLSSVNNTVPQYIGRYAASAALYSNSTIAEFNLIDGQILSPNYFGKTDPVTGAWVPIAYYGTYSYPNSCYLPFSIAPQSTYIAYDGGSASTNVSNPTAALNFGTSDWTIEFWVTFSNIVNNPVIYDARPPATNGAYPCIYLATNSELRYYTNSIDAITSPALVANSWYHIAVCRKSGLTRMFVNGTQVGSTYVDSSNYVNGAARPMLASNGYTVGSNNLSGGMSNLRVVNGTALYASNFTPPSGPLNVVPNTQLLTFQNNTIIDNSPNNYSFTTTGPMPMFQGWPFNPNAVLGYDKSANGNNWAVNNLYISTQTPILADSRTDTPTLTSGDRSNFCTLNPLWTGNMGALYSGNTVYIYRLTNWAQATGTFGVTSGKWYWETFWSDGDYEMAGITRGFDNVQTVNRYPGQDANSWGYFSNGNKFNNSVGTAYGAAYGVGTVIGHALDMDNGTMTFYKDNVSQGVAVTGLTALGPIIPAVGINNGAVFFNAGQQPFFYDPPAGFKKLSAYNLPTPTIPAGNKYFTPTTYTGNGSSFNPISNGTTLYPDFTWVKDRTSSTSHILQDTIRGAGKSLFSDSTSAEAGNSGDLISSFGTGNFVVNTTFLGASNISTNKSGDAYVGWQWQGGQGTSVTNTAGSVTSTVSASPTSGFSIVTFTVPASGVITVGHGLGVAPGFIIVKSRTNAPSSFVVYSAGLGPNQYFLLNTADPPVTSAAFWNNTAPTSSVFTLGSGYMGYGNLVAYCFAEIPGYSKIFYYTGNGSTDGTFVYCGFRPAYIMYKSTASYASAWIILDASRNMYNPEDGYLLPYVQNPEANLGATPLLDFVSNGFKLRFAAAGTNASGEGITYIAFAKNPFKYANAR